MVQQAVNIQVHRKTKKRKQHRMKALVPNQLEKKTSAAAEKPHTTNETENSTRKTTFIVLQKNTRSLNSSERLEEMFSELQDTSWDAILISETWHQKKRYGRRSKVTSWLSRENLPTNTELRSC